MFTLSNLLLGIVLAAMWLLSAYVLRGCCLTTRTPRPGLMGAMVLVLLTAAGSVALHFMLGMTLRSPSFGFGMPPEGVKTLSVATAAPIWMLVGASVYRFLLPTTFGKAMAIFMAQVVVVGAALVGLNMLAVMMQFQALMGLREMMAF